MAGIKYGEDSGFLTEKILAALAGNGCLQQVGQRGQLLNNLNEHFSQTIRNVFRPVQKMSVALRLSPTYIVPRIIIKAVRAKSMVLNYSLFTGESELT